MRDNPYKDLPPLERRLDGDNDSLKITNYDHLKFTKNGKF